MSDEMKLLTDQEVQQFLVTGCTVVQADCGPSFHASICRQIDGVLAEEGNLGNNILPRIPDIARVFDHPNVKGALSSLLGPDYVMNPHRHSHQNPAGGTGQKWHKDCYVYDHNLRNPRFDWVLAFYYPQDTTEDMGPSAILPTTQYYKTISSPDAAETEEEELKICGPAGTVALIHFDSWHRASANTSRKDRYMLKFQFARMAEHDGPGWNHSSSVWSPGIPDPQPVVSQRVWSWMGGGASVADDRAVLESELDAVSEADRLDATFRFVAQGNGRVGEAISAVRKQSLDTIGDTTATTSDNAHGTNPTPGTAALAVSCAGDEAVGDIVPLLRDESWWIRAVAANVLYRIGSTGSYDGLAAAATDDHWWVRRNALEALGEIGETGDALSLLNNGLIDEDYRVRRSGCIGLAKRRAGDAHSVEMLSTVLGDENRYNRFYAGLALSRIDAEDARRKLLDALFTARWCPITTKDDRY